MPKESWAPSGTGSTVKPPVRRLFRCGFTRAKPWKSPGAKRVEIWQQKEDGCQPGHYGQHPGGGGAWEGIRVVMGVAEIRDGPKIMGEWGRYLGDSGGVGLRGNISNNGVMGE